MAVVGDNLIYQGANYLMLLDATTPAAVNAAIAGGTFFFTESTNIVGHPLRETMTIDLANKIANEAYETMLTSYLANVDLSPTDFVFEDGQKVTFSNAPAALEDKYVVAFHLSNEVGGKRRITACLGMLTGDTGNFSTAAKGLADMPVQITAIQAPADYVIVGASVLALGSIACFLSTLSDLTITDGSYGAIVYETAV
jgi:hypothetical protein